MRPQRDDIAAPPLPGRLRWLNVERKPTLAELVASGPLLVHFFDFAQLNSVRALPYVVEWVRRYSDLGLATIGVHTPRFAFTTERAVLAPAIEVLAIAHPVIDDSDFHVWRDYGCQGWPSLFLWAKGGALRWFHFGEGEYLGTEEAIQAELRELEPLAALPEPLEPLRPSDAPGALVGAPSAEVFPGGSASEPWSGGPFELPYEGAGAHASVAGAGELRVALDGGEPRAVPVDRPGLFDLAVHERHERHELVVEPSAGVALYSVSFSAGLPTG